MSERRGADPGDVRLNHIEIDEKVVDQVAQAVHMVGSDWSGSGSDWATLPDYGRDHWRDKARAAILAYLAAGMTPTCPDCGGNGERFDHAAGCDNDNCCLAGGIDDCDGQVTPCHCRPEVEAESSAREEVQFWRADAAARLMLATGAYRIAQKVRDAAAAIDVKVNKIDPILHAFRDADAGAFSVLCEGCGRPLSDGQPVVHFEDAGYVHVDCGEPDAPAEGEGVSLYEDLFTAERMAGAIAEARALSEGEYDA